MSEPRAIEGRKDTLYLPDIYRSPPSRPASGLQGLPQEVEVKNLELLIKVNVDNAIDTHNSLLKAKGGGGGVSGDGQRGIKRIHLQ